MNPVIFQTYCVCVYFYYKIIKLEKLHEGKIIKERIILFALKSYLYEDKGREYVLP